MEIEIEGLPITREAQIIGGILLTLEKSEIKIPKYFFELNMIKGILIQDEIIDGKSTGMILVKGEFVMCEECGKDVPTHMIKKKHVCAECAIKLREPITDKVIKK